MVVVGFEIVGCYGNGYVVEYDCCIEFVGVGGDDV